MSKERGWSGTVYTGVTLGKSQNLSEHPEVIIQDESPISARGPCISWGGALTVDE